MKNPRSRILIAAGAVIAIVLVAIGIIVGPVALNGPRVLKTIPADGEQAANPQAELRIELSQAVQPGSLGGIALDPPIPMTSTVEGTILHIKPQQALRYNTPYRLTIAGLKNQFSRTLDPPLTISFATVPYASVKQYGPSDGATGVPLRGPITVEFEAPVVTTEQVAAAAQDPRKADGLPNPLVLTPEGGPATPAVGIGRWLSPTLYGFYPSDDLYAATTYRAQVQPDVSSDGLARLEKPVSWKFQTAAPLLVGSRPFNGEQDVAPAAAIEIRLAKDVDLTAAGSAFQLRLASGGDALPGVIEPFDGGFRFRPAQPLSNGASYEAVLGAGVKSRTGALLNNQPLRWQFNTIGDPEVLQVEPPPATTEVLTNTHRISVRFSHPIVALTDATNQASLPNPLKITPALQGTGSWLDTSTYVFSPTVGLEPSITYEAVVPAGLRDQTGSELQQAYSWKFATITPAVLSLFPEGSDAPPTSTVRLEFNQPIDPAELPDILLMREPTIDQVAATKRIAGSTVIITPNAPLERGATYRVVAPIGLRSANGKGELASPFSTTFRVAPLPAIADSDPANGDQSADMNGSLQITFSTEMDWASVERNLTITPKPTNVYTSTYETKLYLYFDQLAETNYSVTVGGTAVDRFGVSIGRDTTISFRTAPLEPSLSLISTGGRIGVYNAYATARVPVQVVNLNQANYTLARLTAAESASLASDYDQWREYAPAQPSILRTGNLPTPGERNKARIALIDLGKLAPGLYFLEVQSAGQNDRQILLVSPYTLTIKRGPDRLFVWAVDLATGKPVGNLDLQFASYSYENSSINPPKPLGRTNNEGIIEAPLDSIDASGTLFLWSSGTQAVAFATTDWSSGISAWDFGLTADYGSGNLLGTLTTDRPIYRPEQTVHIRGALRVREFDSSSSNERYRTPAGERATLVISNPEGNNVLTRTLSLNEFGTFSTDLPLDRSATLGSYSLMATLEQDDSATVYGSFSVAEYRKPTFELTVKPSASDMIQGETIDTNVTARYFAGGALAKAPVRWRLLSEPLLFYSENMPDYSFSDQDDADLWYRGDGSTGGGSLIADGESSTDAQGNFNLKLPADLYGRSSTGTTGNSGTAAAESRTLTIEIEITDVDGQVITSQARVQVHAAAFYVGLRPTGYVVKTGDTQKVSLATISPQEAPIANRAVQAEIFRREWYSARQRGEDGRLYWTSSYTDTLMQTIPATTDAQGRTEISFSPTQGGIYRILASAKDDTGRTTKASAFTWVTGGDVFWGVDDTNRVDLIADKRSYRPGETANVLVTAPYAGMSGLLTIERGRVIEHRLITIQGTSQLIPIPITADYAPNVYASLVLIKTPCNAQAAAANPCPEVPELRVGLANLSVSTEQQELQISVTPDKTQAGPRDSITYTIRATDYTGAGVRAEVGLALVDKAVLSLADDPNPGLVQAFYTRRSLAIQTSQSLTALVDRVTSKLQPGDKGGGGADAGPPLRREFPDTAYWNPSVVTAADGTAQVTVALPDSLTTWRMTARGLTTDTRVGQATSDIVATRPLFVRPALPRFLTAGDTPTLQAVVQNTTNAAIDATVLLEIAGDQASAFTLDAPARQNVQVPAGGVMVVRWPAKLGANVPVDGALTLRLTVEGGGQRDAVEATLPLQRFVTPEVVASAGQVIDTTVETIKAPTGDGQVDLQLTPSLAAGIYSGLDYLTAYPYECTEQTVGKFLPNAVTYRLFKQAGNDDAKLKAELQQNLAIGTQRLMALQHLDGGWGWWENDLSNVYITTYVTQGLLEAQKAGMSVDQPMIDNGLAFLERALNGDTLASGKGNGVDDARAFALFVLAEAGKADRGRMVALFEKRSDLQTYGRAYLLMGLKDVGGEDIRIRTLIGELMSSATLTTTEAHWEEQRPDYWTMSSNTRTTALALQALVRADRQNFLIPNATRYLMGLRDHGHWQTTQETAISAIALAEYVASSGELAANYRYTIALDNKQLSEGQVNKDNLSNPITVAIALADLGAGGQSQISMQKQGDGRLYYTLRLRTYADAATVQPLDRGYVVSREYVAVASDTLTPTGRLVTGAKLGEVVQVRLTLQVPEDAVYLAVEDMLPAGLEPLDASLKTVSSAAQEPELNEKGEYPGWWYFTRTTIRDNRVALFATDLPSGTYTYTYLARATTPGVFQTLPALAYQMYAPEVYGRSAGAIFTVTVP